MKGEGSVVETVTGPEQLQKPFPHISVPYVDAAMFNVTKMSPDVPEDSNHHSPFWKREAEFLVKTV